MINTLLKKIEILQNEKKEVVRNFLIKNNNGSNIRCSIYEWVNGQAHFGDGCGLDFEKNLKVFDTFDDFSFETDDYKLPQYCTDSGWCDDCSELNLCSSCTNEYVSQLRDTYSAMKQDLISFKNLFL